MRDFNDQFELQATSLFTRQFWTLVIHFPTGDQYFSDYAWTVIGNAHAPIVTQWGEIGSLANRQEKVLDVSSVTIEMSNAPSLAGSMRISDFFLGNLETVQATIYCNFMDASLNVNQEIVFVGVIDSPIQYDYQTATLTLLAIEESVLNKAALRTLNPSDFPNLREADNGATVPVVLGIVPRSPTRITKGSFFSKPLPDPNNTSTAQLIRVEPRRPVHNEDWQVVFGGSGDEVDEFTGPVDGHSEVGAGYATAASIGHTDTISSGASTTTSLSKSMTLNAACTVLFVHVAFVNPGTPPTVTATWNGVAMRVQGVAPNYSPGIGGRVFQMNLPATGTHTLAISFSSAVAACATVVSLDNAFSGMGKQAAIGYHTTTVSKLTASGAISENHYVDFFARNDGFAGTPFAGQTTLDTTSASASGGLFMGTSSKTASADATTMGWNTASTGDIAHLFLTSYTRESDIYAQSFTLGATQQLAAVRLKIRINPSAPASVTAQFANVYIVSDSSGAPSTADNSVLARRQALVTSRDQTNIVSFVFDVPVTLAAGTYWIVLYAPPVVQANDLSMGSIYWRKGSAGGYSGGNAQAGRFVGTVGESYQYDTTNPAVKAIWTGGMSAQDLWFQAIYVVAAAGVYSVYGSVTGFDGSGDISSDFISNSDAFGIASGDWSGVPSAGDKFYFSIDDSPSTLIVSESPAANPIKSIDKIYWGGQPVGDATIDNIAASSVFRNIGKPDGFHQIAQSFTVRGGLLVKSVQIVAAVAGGTLAGNIKIDICPSTAGFITKSPNVIATVQGTVPDLAAIVSVEIDSTTLSSAPVVMDEVLVEPVALPPGKYFLVVSATRAGDASNYFKIYDGSGSYAGGTLMFTVEPGAIAYPTYGDNWADSTGDLAFKIVAATITKDLSIDDGTGNMVAQISIDTQIPDGIDVWAGVHGISDPSGGYTGTGGALIVRPDHVAHWLLNYWGVADSSLDLNTFVASGARYPTYRFDGVAQETQNRKQLLLQLGFESRSAFDWTRDLATWRWLPLELTDINLTVDPEDVVLTGRLPLVSVKRTDTTKIVNVLDLRYQRRAVDSRSRTSYDRIVNAQAPDSIDDNPPDLGFGRRENPDLFMMDFVRDGVMADDLALYYANRFALPKRVVEFTSKLNLLALDKDDAVNFVLPIIDPDDNYLVTGSRLDMRQRRTAFICEQVETTTVVITHPFGTGFQLPDVQEPTTLVMDERWEIDAPEPTTLIAEELWES